MLLVEALFLLLVDHIDDFLSGGLVPRLLSAHDFLDIVLLLVVVSLRHVGASKLLILLLFSCYFLVMDESRLVLGQSFVLEFQLSIVHVTI